MDQPEFLRQISHAEVLLSQGRFNQADDILKRLLATGYDGPELIKMMAVTKAGLGDYQAAEDLIRMILSKHPDDPFVFYLLATIKGAKREYVEAKSMIDQAINEALQSANTALELDAENIDALNARASALIGLNKKDEAYQTINKSLATDPNNTDTHANMGWSMLHHGQSEDALTHFKEALKNNPNNEYAKGGMLEAMKSKFPVYRYFLMLMLWLGKMKGRNQWAFIVGGYVVYRVLISLAKNSESLKPFLIPIIAIIFLFFLSSWIFSPLMNLYLLTNTYGKFTLSEDQKQSARLVGVTLTIGLLCLLLYFLGIKNEGLLSTSMISFAMMIPLGSMNNPFLEKNRKKLAYFTSAIAFFGLIDCTIALYNQTFTSQSYFLPFLVSIIGYQLYANYVLIRE
ncbi:MAG: tetratricopeptide repeat protein [Saprospiraceae bacterium]|nr:tetratricopeptide repeat protein [Saprospiraceae bacterium]